MGHEQTFEILRLTRYPGTPNNFLPKPQGQNAFSEKVKLAPLQLIESETFLATDDALITYDNVTLLSMLFPARSCIFSMLLDNKINADQVAR